MAKPVFVLRKTLKLVSIEYSHGGSVHVRLSSDVLSRDLEISFRIDPAQLIDLAVVLGSDGKVADLELSMPAADDEGEVL